MSIADETLAGCRGSLSPHRSRSESSRADEQRRVGLAQQVGDRREAERRAEQSSCASGTVPRALIVSPTGAREQLGERESPRARRRGRLRRGCISGRRAAAEQLRRRGRSSSRRRRRPGSRGTDRIGSSPAGSLRSTSTGTRCGRASAGVMRRHPPRRANTSGSSAGSRTVWLNAVTRDISPC